MTGAYTGNLYQLTRISDSATLDVGQTGHVVDLSTYAAFCASTTCYWTKIYAQIHPGSNDLVSSTASPNGCNFGTLTCATPFNIETATSLPVLHPSTPAEYFISGDAAANGIIGGAAAASIVLNGKNRVTQAACCNVFGMDHRYDAAQTPGTDFGLVLSYGTGGLAACLTAATYCLSTDLELSGNGSDYGGSIVAPINVIATVNHDGAGLNSTGYLNGHLVFSQTPGATINAGTRLHLFGGGDFSQPALADVRELMVTNTQMSSGDEAIVRANMKAFYSGLSFPDPSTIGSGSGSSMLLLDVGK
jgi:hypothetical protein